MAFCDFCRGCEFVQEAILWTKELVFFFNMKSVKKLFSFDDCPPSLSYQHQDGFVSISGIAFLTFTSDAQPDVACWSYLIVNDRMISVPSEFQQSLSHNMRINHLQIRNLGLDVIHLRPCGTLIVLLSWWCSRFSCVRAFLTIVFVPIKGYLILFNRVFKWSDHIYTWTWIYIEEFQKVSAKSCPQGELSPKHWPPLDLRLNVYPNGPERHVLSLFDASFHISESLCLM